MYVPHADGLAGWYVSIDEQLARATDLTTDADRLLDDARLVVEYASRAGQLPDGGLPKAITAVEEARKAGTPPDNASLLYALNVTVRAIAPVTLIDLREGRSPFDVRGQRYARRLVALLCVLSILLTGLIGWYTSALNQAESALAAIQQVENVRYVDKVRAVRRLAQDEEVFTKHDARYANYHQQLGELALARAANNAAFGLIDKTSQSDLYPFQSVFESLWSRAEYQPPTEMDRPLSTDVTSEEPPQKAVAESAAKKDLIADYEFLESIGDDNPGILLSPTFGTQYAFTIRTQRLIFSGWVLPFLYGLLGASVYLMRSLLNERTANLAFFPVVLRLALGGIAGLVIGWFSAPGAGTSTTSISSIPFGVAFLAGFSIDTLFALLERLTQTLSGSVRRQTGSAQSKPTRVSKGPNSN